MFLNIDEHNSSHFAAIDTKQQKITYGELAEFCKEFKSHIDRRTLIFILSENSVGSLAGYVASLENRVVPLIISSTLEKNLLEDLIKKYEPQYIWAPTNFNLDSNNRQNVYRSYNYKLIKFTQNPVPVLHEDLSLLLSTSGSTGSPKLVRHSYQNVSSNAKNISDFFKLKKSDRAIAILPMHYTMGLSVVTSNLFAGATILLTDLNLVDRKFWDFIKEKKATSFTGVPFSFEILKKLRFFKMDLPHLELISQGGGKLDEKLFKELAEYALSNNKRFVATYGQTEGTARMSFLPPEVAHLKTGSIGKAIPMGKLFLRDFNGDIITESNVEGELVYEGPNVTLGYAMTKEDLKKGDERNGILHTGDVAFKDEEGYFFIIGRKKRFLKIHGTRVSLDEIENLVKSQFKTDCYCTGNDDLMKIFITNGEIMDAVAKHIKQKTGLYHKSYKVEHILEIPRNEYGKVIFN